MKKRTLLITICIALLLPVTSCIKSLICINGNGKQITETRRSQKFTSIENTTSFDVFYKRSDTFGISIEAEENLISYIETNTSGEHLEITTSPGTICLDYNIKPVIRISAPVISEAYNTGSGDLICDRISGKEITIRITGSGDITVDRIDGESADIGDSGSGNINIGGSSFISSDIKVSGSGDITISGDCESAHLKTTGSGNIYGFDYYTTNTSAIVTGSGSIYVRVEKYLNGLLSGSGNVYYKGTPEVDQTTTGSGRIIKQK